MYWLLGLLAPTIFWFLVGLFLVVLDIEMAGDRAVALGLVISLIAAWSGFAIISRRLHDFGYSAWWFLPIVLIGAGLGVFRFELSQWAGIIWSIFLGFIPGNTGPNRFGADPKGSGSH